jgi:threonine synthase
MTSVTYSSTRGQQNHVSFRDVVMIGLANDKGLFIPDTIPQVSIDELNTWRLLYSNDYIGLAIAVLSKFVQDDQVPYSTLQSIVQRSCSTFRHPDVTPVVTVGGHSILVRVIIKSHNILISRTTT